MGNWEATAAPWIHCWVPQAIAGPFLLCVKVHFPAERGHCLQGILFPQGGELGLDEVGAMCQSNIHINGRTQCFLAEHYPKHRTSISSLGKSPHLHTPRDNKVWFIRAGHFLPALMVQFWYSPAHWWRPPSPSCYVLCVLTSTFYIRSCIAFSIEMLQYSSVWSKCWASFHAQWASLVLTLWPFHTGCPSINHVWWVPTTGEYEHPTTPAVLETQSSVAILVLVLNTSNLLTGATVMRKLMLSTSFLSGYNVLADWCMLKHLYVFFFNCPYFISTLPQ